MTSKGLIDHSLLDRQIEEILTCKPIPESEIKALCEKVPPLSPRPKKCSPKNPMLCQCAPLLLSAETFTGSSTT